MRGPEYQRGSILIFALWILALLAVLAVQVGVRIRQRATFVSRLEHRTQLRLIAEAGIKKGMAALKREASRGNFLYTPFGKYYRFNNPESFSDIKIGPGSFEVSYMEPGTLDQKRFGTVDEESKINLNTTDFITLKRLIEKIIEIEENDAQAMAEAIIDWRDAGQSQLTGFYSDNDYDKLGYKAKDLFFETIDELLLIPGIDNPTFEKLIKYVTIYGDGAININTASAQVLTALGLDPLFVDKLLAVRRGPDGVEATMDDFIFQKTFDIVSDMKKQVDVESSQGQKIDQLNARNILKPYSLFYFIESRGKYNNTNEELTIRCVYNTEESRIEYWREKH